jgi:hypothetical protein
MQSNILAAALCLQRGLSLTPLLPETPRRNSFAAAETGAVIRKPVPYSIIAENTLEEGPGGISLPGTRGTVCCSNTLTVYSKMLYVYECVCTCCMLSHMQHMVSQCVTCPARRLVGAFDLVHGSHPRCTALLSAAAMHMCLS